MNDTPSSERLHIGFFGRRNAGKSSLVNAVTGQDIVIVSEIKGTTTDPVQKSMELLPLGPVLIIDTPGIDDEGMLGELRIRKTRQVLNRIDIALLAVDAVEGKKRSDEELLEIFMDKKIPYIIVWNKSDLLDISACKENDHEIYVSAKYGMNISRLKEKIGYSVPSSDHGGRVIGDLISEGDFVVLVTPIDKAAPKGRLILPQQQTIRDILEADATAIVVKEHELKDTLANLGKKPAFIITDSQVFAKVSADVPRDIPLTSFSILFARYRGFLAGAVEASRTIDGLEDEDRVLICEGCTHHRQCDDIGTVKLPRWIRNYTGRFPNFYWTSGSEFPEDLLPYRLVIHCGGCMQNRREVRYREKCAADQGIPFTNYGVAIAHIQGILDRCVERLL